MIVILSRHFLSGIGPDERVTHGAGSVKARLWPPIYLNFLQASLPRAACKQAALRYTLVLLFNLQKETDPYV